MGLKRLNLETLKDVDFGRPGVAFGKCLERAVRDCLDRPGDNRARKVTLQINVVPIAETRDNVVSCEAAGATIQSRVKIPDYETETLNFGVQENGTLFFSEECPKNHKQASFLEEESD